MKYSEPVVMAVEVTPFWLRLPLFFRYPLHSEPLLYMLLLAMLTLMGFVIPVPSPLDHLLVHLGVWLAFIRYSYKTLDQTAQGLLTPDQHMEYDAGDRASLPYKQFAILLVLSFVLGVAESVGALVFGAVLVFGVLALPASVMILSITQSFWAGLNPLAALGMMRMIGMPYLGLCGFLFLLSASQQVLSMALMPRVPGWLLLPTVNFVAMYFTLIMFNMMGYVIYQYHQKLGLRVSVVPEGKTAEEGGIGQLIADGRIKEALEMAYEAQRMKPDDIAANDRYHKLLVLAGRTERLVSHGRRYLSLLLGRERGDDALALYRKLVERDRDFSPEQPEQLLRLAEVARRQRDFAQALAFVRGFDKRFPRHGAIPAVYLFAARVLCENLRQDAAAQQILSVLLEQYPEHPLAAEARQLQAVLEKLAGAAAGAGTAG